MSEIVNVCASIATLLTHIIYNINTRSDRDDDLAMGHKLEILG